MKIFLLGLILVLSSVDSLRFLLYNPMNARSHVNFLGKLADVLVDGGHEVVLIGPTVDPSIGTFGTKKAKIIALPQTKMAAEYQAKFANKFVENTWKSSDPLEMLKEIKQHAVAQTLQCKGTLAFPGLMEQLRSQNFDAAFAEPLDYCGFLIFELLGIKNTALAMSISTFDGSFPITGVPMFLSYVPGSMASFGEKMTFFERIKNIIPLAFDNFLTLFLPPYEDLIKNDMPAGFPSMMELVQRTSFTFLNRDALLDFPTPTAHKIIDVGGISVHMGHKPLNKTWSDILDLRPRTVLLSFGTVAKSFLMPEEYKETIRATLAKFPDVTFIWKYEEPSHNVSAGISNIVEATFVPQNDMLYDPRLSLFITHCGQGSTTEAVTAGIPLIVVPVLGDQYRNAQIVKRLGTGYILQKEQLNRTDALEAAIRKVLGNDEYIIKARRVGEMIRDKPFAPKDLFLKNMEFLAKYGPLRQLDHYGTQLNFFQYYLLDVFAFLASIVLVVLGVVLLVLRSIFRCLSRSIRIKSKSD